MISSVPSSTCTVLLLETKLVDVVSRSNTYRRTSCCSLRVLFVRVRVRWAIYAAQFRPSWRYDVDGRRCSRQYIDLMGGWLARHPPHPTASLAATFQTLRMMCFHSVRALHTQHHPVHRCPLIFEYSPTFIFIKRYRQCRPRKGAHRLMVGIESYFFRALTEISRIAVFYVAFC